MFYKKCTALFCLVLLAGCSALTNGSAADWPMWRCNANRGADSPHELPAPLHLQWVREYPKLATAWTDQSRLRFDKAYSPVVMGKTMFVGSSHNDSVRALDTETGAERWTFYAGGPVRFAPVAWRGKLYFACDDGHLYCLSAAKGTVLWKFRGGPSDRKVLGNQRLISAWPVRGAPTLIDGKVYFGASVWPFMGIFIYALDAETGKVVWSNDKTGSMYALRPHHSPAFSGLAPQGYLAAVGDDLLIPNGRTTVARVDRRTGELIYHHAVGSGTYHLAAAGRFFFNAGTLFETKTGKPLNLRSNYGLVITDKMIYATGPFSVRAYEVADTKVREVEDRLGRVRSLIEVERQWRVLLTQYVASLIKAGPRLYAGGRDLLAAIDLPAEGEPKVSWRGRVEGTVVELLAADRKLFAVTLEGRIYCFGAKEVTPKKYLLREALPARPADEWADRARAILEGSGVREGYCVVLGVGTGRLVEELARQSRLHVIVVEKDAEAVAAARQKLDKIGLYGRRAVVVHGDPETYPLPPYLASLVASEKATAAGFLRKDSAFVSRMTRIVRPYGGVVCLRPATPRPPSGPAPGPALQTAGLTPGPPVKGFALFVRRGALPGAANWTHQYADAANTAVSEDERVRAPLGLLWFGGPSNREVLPRHGHGPSPQVVGGRLFIEGANMFRAVDVYTGRLLWQISLPGVGTAYDNTNHQPGVNALGSNYVSLPDSVYLVYRKKCLRLDPATGRQLSAFTLPRQSGEKKDPGWGFISIHKDLLIAGADPISVSGLFEERNLSRQPIGLYLDGTSSERMVVMNRFTGKVLWQRRARYGFVHNTIVAGGDKVFCIDRPRVPRGLLPDAERGEERPVPGSTLWALHVTSGKPAWSKTESVFGTWLSYSKARDLLLEAGRAGRDMVWDEANSRMVVFRAKNGTVLWDEANKYTGPCLLHGDTIIAQSKAYSLLTGERRMRRHPLTGQQTPWGYRRNYGCGSSRGARHLLTFRSAAAGYFDLARDGGTGNFGGFKSGCTANLIPANGVLNAPDYTRTCNCGYPNQSSLALIHMPEVDTWTFNDLKWDGEPIRRMGLNLGAPGDRRAPDGTLWLEYPYVGGPTPEIAITMTPALDPDEDPAKAPGRFLRHSSRIKGAGLRWVAASGMKGVTQLAIPLALPVMKVEGPDGAPVIQWRPLKERTHTVRLHFSEPDPVKPGERVFSVSLQGREVLKGFDVVKEAGGRDRPVVKEFKGVRVKESLVVELTPAAGSADPLLCGVEVLAEGW